MLLGIEIGGTKLQLGVGRGDGSPLVGPRAIERRPGPRRDRILAQIEAVGGPLVARHRVQAIGVGFGGPIDAAKGLVLKSHQIDGWTNFALADWLRKTFALPVTLATMPTWPDWPKLVWAPARGRNPVFYITVGTGIGGGLIVDGQIYRGSGSARPRSAIYVPA